MKKTLLPLALALCSSAFAQNITSVPFYFAVPEEAHLKIADKNWKKVPVKDVNSDKAYLRSYAYQDGYVLTGGVASKTPGATLAAKKKVRLNAVKDLVAKGILKHGDVVLSFRPSWENTIPYAHIQMGVSHAGLIYVENGVAKNLDMPLDSEYNGNSVTSGLDSNHYLETDHLQIVRPRDFNATRGANLTAWVKELRKNYTGIRGGGLLKFNPDYSAAKIDRYSAGDSFVTTMGKILLGQNKSSTDLTMFCSEFTWAILSLSHCSPSDISAETSADARCVTPAFEAMMMTANGSTPGLTEGPLAVLDSLDISSSEKTDLMDKLFAQGAMNGLSSGHRALATNPQVQQLIGALQMLYPSKLAGNAAMVGGISQQINQTGGRNYSPTSFLVNAMLDSNDSERKFDYVATIVFAPKL